MAKAVGSLTFQMKVDDSKFTPTLNSMKQQVRNFNQTMKANVSAAKEAGDTLGSYEAKVEGLRVVVEKQKAVQESLAGSLKATGERTKDNALAYDKAKSELDKAAATYKNYNNQLDAAVTKYEKMKTGISALNNVIETERKYTNELSSLYKAQGSNIDSVRVKTEGLEQENKRLNALRRKETELLGSIATKNGFASKAYIEQATRVESLSHTILNNNTQISKNSKYLDSNADVLSKLKKEYALVGDANKSIVERFKAENNTVKANISQLGAYKDSLKQLTNQYKLQSEDLSKMQSSSSYSRAEIEKQKKTVNETATAYARMRSNLKDTQKEVDAANPFGISKYASAANSAYRGSVKMQTGFSNAFTNIKDKAMSASLGIIGVGAAAVKGASEASELQNSYIKTLNLATTGGEKAAEAQKNVNQMQKDGAKYSVEYGKSQSSIAEGYQELIKRGYTSTEALGAMRSELEASVASGDDFNNVLTVTSQVVDAYGLRTNNAAKMTKNTKDVVNQLAYAADMTATDFQSLGKGMEYVGDTAHSAGFALSETSSAMGILSNHGLEADKAGTGLRKVINSITGALSDQKDAQEGAAQSAETINGKIADQKKKLDSANESLAKANSMDQSTEKGKKAAAKAIERATKATQKQQDAVDKLNGKLQGIQANDMLDKLGISRDKFVDAKGNLKDLTSMMAEINDKTKGMGTAEKESVFNKLFGTTGQQAGIILAENNKELDELNHKVKKSADGQGYVANLAKKNMQSVKMQMSQFAQAGNAALIMIGKQMLPVISEAAVAMTHAFDSKEGQEGLKKIADGVAFVAGKMIDGVKFLGAHTNEVKAFAAAFASIWAVKKIGDTLNLIKQINEALKITQGLNMLTNGSVLGGDSAKHLATTVEKQAAISGASTVAETAVPKASAVASAAIPVAASTATKVESAAASTGATTLSRTAAGAAANTGVNAVGSVLSKLVPYIGVLTGLAQAGVSAYSATKEKNPVSQRGDIGAAAGATGGTALGAVIGSAIVPGIGTALGAALGGTLGKEVGKKSGIAYQEGFKESHPKSLSAWLGDDWDGKYKNSSSKIMKDFSKDYNDKIAELNKNTIGVKMTIDDKDTDANKKKVEGIYKGLQDVIDNFYSKQNNESKKNLDALVKAGAITQKQEDEYLKNAQTNNQKKKENEQKLVTDMKGITTKFYDDKANIENGGTKTLQEIAVKDGKNSKKYKTEVNNELLALQKQYSKDLTADEVKLNDKVSKDSQIAASKQEDILTQLNNKKKKLSLKDIMVAEDNAQKNYNAVIGNATKVKNDAIKAADKKYQGVKELADKEYYQNHDISYKQYKSITGNADQTRKDTIDAAEKQFNGKKKKADDEYGEITKKAEAQRKKVTEKSALQKNDVIANAQEQKDKTTKLGQEQKSALVQAMEDQKNGVTGHSKTQHKDVTTHSKNQKDTTISHAQEQKDKTTTLGNEQKNNLTGAALDQSKGVVGHATAQANSSLDAASKQASGTHSIWKGLGEFFNGLVKGFGIKGVDVKSGGDFGYKPVTMGALATGHRGVPNAGKALVGEAGVEARYSPYSGKVDFLGSNGAQVVDLQPGDRILNAKDTEKLFKGGLGKTLPGYAKGTSSIESFLSSMTKGASDIWDDVTDAAGEAIEKITDPIKSMTDMASKIFDVNKLEVGDTGHNSSNGMVKSSIEDGFGKMIKGLKSGYQSSGASGDGGAGRGAPSGASVSRWTDQVKDALKANGLSTSESMVNKVLRQIQTESGGNEKAVQGDIGDENNRSGDLAKGLMQVITSTFNANKFPGHNNQFNGYDSLLAGLNYAKKKYGSDLSFLGQGHGYANGGIATTPSIFGEAGPEMAVPLDNLKRSRAVQLTKQLNEHFASDMKDSNNNNNSSDNTEVVEQLKNAVELLTQLVIGQKDPVNTKVVLDKNELYRTQANDAQLRGYQTI